MDFYIEILISGGNYYPDVIGDPKIIGLSDLDDCGIKYNRLDTTKFNVCESLYFGSSRIIRLKTNRFDAFIFDDNETRNSFVMKNIYPLLGFNLCSFFEKTSIAILLGINNEFSMHYRFNNIDSFESHQLYFVDLDNIIDNESELHNITMKLKDKFLILNNNFPFHNKILKNVIFKSLDYIYISDRRTFEINNNGCIGILSNPDKHDKDNYKIFIYQARDANREILSNNKLYYSLSNNEYPIYKLDLKKLNESNPILKNTISISVESNKFDSLFKWTADKDGYRSTRYINFVNVIKMNVPYELIYVDDDVLPILGNIDIDDVKSEIKVTTNSTTRLHNEMEIIALKSKIKSIEQQRDDYKNAYLNMIDVFNKISRKKIIPDTY